MSTQIVVPFDVTGWDEAPYDEPADGPRLARATVTKQFRGALEGESRAELLMCQADPDELSAGAGYVASERVVGQLEGRSGSFVLQHGGLGGVGVEPYTFGTIVPGSATGALAGLRGSAQFDRAPDGSHTLTLDYAWDEAAAGNPDK